MAVVGGMASIQYHGSSRWYPAPLLALAQRFPARDAVWAWLRSNGVERPAKQPRRVRVPSLPRATVTLGLEARVCLATLVQQTGAKPANAILSALRAAVGATAPIVVSPEDAARGASPTHRLRVLAEHATRELPDQPRPR